MPVNGGQKCHQNDCDTLNFAWMGFNSAPGMHLPWIDPGKLNSAKCCHFAANASPKMQKCPLMDFKPSRNVTELRAVNTVTSPYRRAFLVSSLTGRVRDGSTRLLGPVTARLRRKLRVGKGQLPSTHHSMQSSVWSPLNNGYLAATYGAASGIMSPESVPHTGDLPGIPGNEPIGQGIGEQENGSARSKGRPAQLTLSPSDGALNVSASQTNEIELHDDERAVMNECVSYSKRGSSGLYSMVVDVAYLPACRAHHNASVRRRLFAARSPVGSLHEKDKDSAKDKESAKNKNSTKGSTKESASSKDADSAVDLKPTEPKDSNKKKESTIATGTGRHAGASQEEH
ncbi:hypothetical protein C8J57DRAFT_1238819 [Mycena rebaudengoi]|nr:hypothetical protein C8J57DRAFT_1238819 [Mycena rebaudengoi]